MLVSCRWKRRGRLFSAVLAAVAGASHGAEPAVPLHPLVTASEVLGERRLGDACDLVVGLAFKAPGLTDDDRIRLRFLAAMRAAESGKDEVAREGVAEILKMDRSAQAPPWASLRLREILEGARAQLPPPPRAAITIIPGNEKLENARKAAAQRAPASTALLGAVDLLYSRVQFDGARAVLEQARQSARKPGERAQVELWQGILEMEGFNERGAREAFHKGLAADLDVQLSQRAPKKTRKVFEEERAKFSTVIVAESLPPPPDTRRWGYAAGGAGLALTACGVVSGIVGLVAFQQEQKDSANGDVAGFIRSRATAAAARNIADGCYGAGIVAFGTGAYLIWRAPGGFSFGATAGEGQVGAVLGGEF